MRDQVLGKVCHKLAFQALELRLEVLRRQVSLITPVGVGHVVAKVASSRKDFTLGPNSIEKF